MAANTLSTTGLFVAQDGAPYLEATRQGGHWNVMTGAATPLVAFPTTTALLEVWNNVAANQMMVITDLMLFHLLGTAALHNISIWAQVASAKAVPTVTGLVVGSQSGRAPFTSAAGSPFVTGAGTTVVANGWRPWGTPGSGVVSTALPGEAFSVPIDGKLIVPPGCSLCLTAVDALATASSVQVGAAWYTIPNASTTAPTPA